MALILIIVEVNRIQLKIVVKRLLELGMVSIRTETEKVRQSVSLIVIHIFFSELKKLTGAFFSLSGQIGPRIESIRIIPSSDTCKY